MPRLTRLLVALWLGAVWPAAVRVVAGAGALSPAIAGDGSWAWPVPDAGPLADEHRFDAPDSPYSAGHRGVDLSTLVGAPVRAVADGVVAYVRKVAGVDVISVDHGTERSTYQPVTADVEVGERVHASDVIGHIAPGPFHCVTPCLHLGRIARADERYLDPFERLASRSHIRLVDPNGPPPVPPVGSAGAGLLRRPVAGPVTSRFGMRKHPMTGKRSLHTGVDFGAHCGTDVGAAADGVVVRVEHSPAYGLRVVVRHSPDLTTSYSHLSRAVVHEGESVSTSSTVGQVGSSGLSTGCHLHFGVRRDGRDVDPLTLL
ncbi:MAG TPA: peptidoglycan DD-metalloendopeptidase family protein [Aeromicrobium sp.]|nr:peptidoglycan DD-metalloendopeptidase family protein [Aeromicrobium sp.]